MLFQSPFQIFIYLTCPGNNIPAYTILGVQNGRADWMVYATKTKADEANEDGGSAAYEGYLGMESLEEYQNKIGDMVDQSASGGYTGDIFQAENPAKLAGGMMSGKKSEAKCAYVTYFNCGNKENADKFAELIKEPLGLALADKDKKLVRVCLMGAGGAGAEQEERAGTVTVICQWIDYDSSEWSKVNGGGVWSVKEELRGELQGLVSSEDHVVHDGTCDHVSISGGLLSGAKGAVGM